MYPSYVISACNLSPSVGGGPTGHMSARGLQLPR